MLEWQAIGKLFVFNICSTSCNAKGFVQINSEL